MFSISQQFLTETMKKQIDASLGHHALQMVGHDEKFQPITFIAMDDQIFAGAIVVGLFWGAIHVRKIYVGGAYRHQGLGTKLMEYAFTYGIENKCPFAFVETMSFQALSFYQKNGFQLDFTRSGYSHGTSFHYLQKKLIEDHAP